MRKHLIDKLEINMQKFTLGLTAIFVFFTLALTAQKPVHWNFEIKSLGGNEYNLIFHAKIDKNWAVYSQHIEGDGPVPTTFEFEDGAHFTKVGPITESGHKKSGFDEVFKMNITKFVEDGIFTQKVKVNDFSKPITGYLNFMTCNDKTCLPPTDVDFSFSPQPAKQAPVKGKEHPKKAVAPPKATPKVKQQPKPTPKKTTKKKVAKKQPKKVNKAQTATPAPTPPPAPKVTPKQNPDLPVQWSWSAKKISDKEYDIILKAKIKDHWGLYSQKQESDDGPLPTVITFDKENATTKGFAKESDNLVTKFDKVFEMNVGKFKNHATFTQRVTVKDPSKPVKGYIDYMTCDDSKCMNQTIDFVVPLSKDATAANTYDADKSKHFKGYFDTKRDIDSNASLSACGGDGSDEGNSKSLWMIFFLGIAGGLFALLTPCVFPLIPLTVSFFTKGGKDRKKGVRDAMIYGLSIIFIYVSMGTILTGVFGPTILNDMATNVWMNVTFFILFVVFAISFFGVFEITLPSSWANKSDKAADRGGLIGIFFMAFTLAIVSFSCTGPIIGSLLVQSASGAEALFGVIPVQPLVGMFGFSLALALPFTLFAMFPAWLNNLPKSGSWMNNVKVTLGFLELALALKFLSVADMVKHWGIMKFELFMVLWILIFLGLGLYHLGVYRFKNESKKRPGIFRLALGVLSLLFVGYMAKGLYNYKSMNLLSGLAPPVHYNYFGAKKANGESKECPYDLNCFHDFDEGIAYAKEVGKPVFLDFTGYGCVNCRKMEENVWNKPGIMEHLQDNFVVISLYVDDKERLFPDNKQAFLLDRNNGQKLRTVGSKWAAFEVNNFGKSSQPYYVLMDNDGLTLLNKPVAFTPDIATYKNFLDCGLAAFKNKKKLIGKKKE